MLQNSLNTWIAASHSLLAMTEYGKQQPLTRYFGGFLKNEG
jgi:hypothetical protein